MALKLPHSPADGRMSEKRHDPWTLTGVLRRSAPARLSARTEVEAINLRCWTNARLLRYRPSTGAIAITSGQRRSGDHFRFARHTLII
jgi:hypothetical protein